VSNEWWHFGDINVIVTLNLDHTTVKIDVLCGSDAMAICVVWSKFNVTVTLMSPKCQPCLTCVEVKKMIK